MPLGNKVSELQALKDRRSRQRQIRDIEERMLLDNLDSTDAVLKGSHVRHKHGIVKLSKHPDLRKLQIDYERLRERERQIEAGYNPYPTARYSRNSSSSMSIHLPDEHDIPKYNPSADPKLAQLAESHGRQMEMLQGRNRDLERQREEIRRRLEELGKRPLKGDDQTAALLQELRDQEARNQRLLDELKRQLMAAKQPINIIEQTQEKQSKQFIYPMVYGGSLVQEISAIRMAYIQNGGNDPEVLSQLAQMLAEAQALENQLRNPPPRKVKEKQTDFSQNIWTLEMENERLQRELMFLQEQNLLARTRRKDEREGRTDLMYPRYRSMLFPVYRSRYTSGLDSKYLPYDIDMTGKTFSHFSTLNRPLSALVPGAYSNLPSARHHSGVTPYLKTSLGNSALLASRYYPTVTPFYSSAIGQSDFNFKPNMSSTSRYSPIPTSYRGSKPYQSDLDKDLLANLQYDNLTAVTVEKPPTQDVPLTGVSKGEPVERLDLSEFNTPKPEPPPKSFPVFDSDRLERERRVNFVDYDSKYGGYEPEQIYRPIPTLKIEEIVDEKQGSKGDKSEKSPQKSEKSPKNSPEKPVEESPKKSPRFSFFSKSSSKKAEVPKTEPIKNSPSNNNPLKTSSLSPSFEPHVASSPKPILKSGKTPSPSPYPPGNSLTPDSRKSMRSSLSATQLHTLRPSQSASKLSPVVEEITPRNGATSTNK